MKIGVEKDTTMQIDCGVTESITIPANSSADKQVSFNKSFANISTVVACVNGYYTPATEITGVNIIAMTRTGFTARIRNSYNQQLTPKINWIAIGTK